MKILKEILHNVEYTECRGGLDVAISKISLNSKEIEANSLFIAIVGHVVDGHVFIGNAIEKGATCIVYQNDIHEYKDGVTYIKVVDTHEASGVISSNFYNNPSSKLKLVGVTGTNGKTTTVTLLHSLFRILGYKAGMIGTVVNKINDESIESERTTPDPITLNTLLSDMVQAGCEYCFMEVSSHAVSEKRITGLSFAGGVFTNLTLDHLDYHKTIENYKNAKKGFFDSLSESAFAVSNKDDASGEYMLSNTKAHVYFYSLKSEANFTDRLESKLIGEFNAYNILAIYATAVLLGQDTDKVKEIIKNLEPVAGRFQYIKSVRGVTGIVDYAHTPDALENVLQTIHQLNHTGKVISVFGCGGDRDKTKRPIMARIGYDMSDILILTSDNPRTEKPEDILNDMREGLPSEDGKVYIISDRHLAIEKACSLAQNEDFVLVAGKGHETYQDVHGVKNYFDDMEELKKYLHLNDKL